MTLNAAANPGRHRLADRGSDLYETPPEATRTLLTIEKVPHRIWEPACGPGAIVRVLEDNGYDVVATDLLDYRDRSDALQNEARVDFLMETRYFDRAIVTNPPYKLANRFVRKAIADAPYVAMLLRLAFLESLGRDDILSRLSRVHVFSRRLPMMHRGGWAGPRCTSSVAYAWFIWDRAHIGPTTVHRVDWKDFA